MFSTFRAASVWGTRCPGGVATQNCSLGLGAVILKDFRACNADGGSDDPAAAALLHGVGRSLGRPIIAVTCVWGDQRGGEEKLATSLCGTPCRDAVHSTHAPTRALAGGPPKKDRAADADKDLVSLALDRTSAARNKSCAVAPCRRSPAGRLRRARARGMTLHLGAADSDGGWQRRMYARAAKAEMAANAHCAATSSSDIGRVLYTHTHTSGCLAPWRG